MYIKRDITKQINDVGRKFPIIAITGPRQSGKTTLSKEVFGKYEYVNLEDIQNNNFASIDPVGFINKNSKKVIFDEVQKTPSLFSQIQVKSDELQIPAQFVLSGSENFTLSEKISQSLAGRVINFKLLPLSINELKRNKLLEGDIASQILKGFYPRLYTTEIPYADYYVEYITSYVERDVRQIKNIGNLSLFRKFIQLLAGRIGQILNMDSLGNDLGVDHKTVESWISVLESSYIAFRLQPYYANIGKRLVKSPKVYFYDTGVACALLGINTIGELSNHYLYGSLFENMIVADILKNTLNFKRKTQLYFLRDKTGNELDLLVDTGSSLLGIEIKSGQTFSMDFFKGINLYKDRFDKEFKSCVIYGGHECFALGNTEVQTWDSMNIELK